MVCPEQCQSADVLAKASACLSWLIYQTEKGAGSRYQLIQIIDTSILSIVITKIYMPSSRPKYSTISPFLVMTKLKKK